MTQEPATRISPELRMLLLGVERNRLDAATVISALEQATRAMQAGDSFCLDSWLAGESGLSPEEIGELRNLVSETTPADPGLVETLLLDKPDVETLSEDPILQAGATRKAALDGHIRNMWAEESAPGPEASGFGRFSDLEFLAEGAWGRS